MKRKTMIKLIAFDLDGTIGDTIPMCMKAFKKAVEPYTSRELSEQEIIQTFGLNEEGMVKQVLSDDNWQKALNDFYVIYEEMHIMCPHPLEGIVELIKELKEKSISVALITGKGEKSCAITLKQFGMNTCFDRIETGIPERNRKPEAIKNLLEIYNLQPDEMIYVGDTVSDIMACHEAGIKCLSAAWVVSPEAVRQLVENNPDRVFISIPSLRDFLIGSVCNT